MIRGVTGLVGLALAAYGGVRLLALGRDNLVATVTWLVGGVALHDALLAPIALGVSVLSVRLVPRERLAPWAVALVVLAPVTLLSIPVLGRFGARATEPSLLDRHYWLGWFALLGVVGAAILMGRIAHGPAGRSPRNEGGDDGQGHGRR